MATSKKNKALHISLWALLAIVVMAGGYAVWLTKHYKQIIIGRLPGIITDASDSIYHVSLEDVSVNIFKHQVTLTGLKLWPDEKQVVTLRERHHKVPTTISTLFIPSLIASGIEWDDLLSKRSLDCKNVIVRDLKWSMAGTPHPQDSLFTGDKKSKPVINRVTAARIEFINPDITYRYNGAKEIFTCFMKGGNAILNKWAYYDDITKDTTTFLFAKSGKVRFNSFIFSKPAGRYVVKTPTIDFEAPDGHIILKSVKIKQMADYDQQTGKEKEIYDLGFPTIDLTGFNWNRLIFDGELRISKVQAERPGINIRYIRENAPQNSRTGDYPNQLLLQVGLATNIKEVALNGGLFKYTEVTKKGDEGTIEFTGIGGSFGNITNIPAVIAQHKSCMVKLNGKFMNKSPMTVNFDLLLTDDKGQFKVDGFLENLDGAEVTPQAQVFTIVKVTSFHLTHMDIHIEGDESYAKGDFTVLYHDLKISLLKFDTKLREKKRGLFAFAGSTLVLYQSNPLPGKDVRKVSTSFARDTTKGFISVIWQHMYRAAKKTAVREQGIVTLTDGPETGKGDQPKKGFLNRLFGKKNK